MSRVALQQTVPGDKAQTPSFPVLWGEVGFPPKEDDRVSLYLIDSTPSKPPEQAAVLRCCARCIQLLMWNNIMLIR
jgi:hypothetical protein